MHELNHLVVLIPTIKLLSHGKLYADTEQELLLVQLATTINGNARRGKVVLEWVATKSQQELITMHDSSVADGVASLGEDRATQNSMPSYWLYTKIAIR